MIDIYEMTTNQKQGSSFQMFTYDSWSHLRGPRNHAGHHTAEQRGCSDLNHIGKNLDDTSVALKDSQHNDV